MSPREKAKELVDKYDSTLTYLESKSKAKQCALIAVDEMLRNDGWSSSRDEWDTFKKYYEEVKKEIELL